ncbi:MAG: hypothetical protein AAGE52_31840 [Myxococcota bacterium]
MDTVLKRAFVGFLLVAACTEFAPRDELEDVGVDTFDAGDAGFDAFDAGCTDPPIGECPPLCLRERVVVGVFNDLVGGRVVNLNAQWTCDNLYVLDGETYLEGDTVITIRPGTIIEGTAGAALVATADARVEALGTAEAPIVMRSETSARWRGLYLLGRAPVSVGEGETTDRVERLQQDRAEYGGTDPSHDCGTLNYVRIENGSEAAGGAEAESLFLGGCGDATEIDFVHVDQSRHDAIQINGGGFAVRHVVLSLGREDGVQWDLGWNGTLQYVVAHMTATSESALQAESPIDSSVRRSNVVVANMTTIGSTSNDHAVNLNGSALLLGNSIFVGYNEIMEREDRHTREFGLIDVDVRNNIISPRLDEYFDNAEVDRAFAPPMNGNEATDPMLPSTGTDEILGRSPSWRPGGTAATTVQGALPDSVDPTDYSGAIDPDPDVPEWTEGWTVFR